MSTEVIKVKKDEYLLKENEESCNMYYLQSGTMKVYKNKASHETEIGVIYSGELVGEMSFLDKKPRSASVKACSDCELIVIPADKYEKLSSELPVWFRALIVTLLDRLRRANARIKV